MFESVSRPAEWTRRGVLTTLAVIVALAIAWLAFQATLASIALSKASAQSEVLRSALVTGDQESAEQALDQLAVFAERAKDNSDGPLWWLVERLPLIGDEAEALSTISHGVDLAVREALPPLMDVAGELESDTFAIVDGQIDLEVFTTLQPALEASDAAYAPVVRAVEDLDTSGLFGRLHRPIVTARDQLLEVGAALDSAARAASLLPTVLGADGPRTYLVAVQSNAETRPLGGVPGTWILIRAEAGAVDVVDTGSSIDLLALDAPALPLSQEETALYGTTIGTDFRNAMLNPHYPRSAELASAIFAARRGVTVDGVISVDPVALSYLLRGTGPIAAADGTYLTSDNAVELLLNQSYVAFQDGPSQNAFFEGTARAVFDAFAAGQGDPSTTVRALATAALERRVLVWLRDPALEEQLGQTVVAGRFGPDGDSPTVGIFLSDRTETKLEYYLSSASSVTSSTCSDDRQSISVRTVLTSGVPLDPSSLPLSVVGLAPYAPPGTMVLRLRAYAPSDGTIETVRVDGDEVAHEMHLQGDRMVAFIEFDLAPQESRTVTITMESGEAQTEPGHLLTTPGVNPGPTEVTIRSGC